MARLHYGTTMTFDLDPTTTRQVTETIDAHASRGGWITFNDRDGRPWSILVTPGIPICLEADPEPPAG
jgi:hypothetical protein